MSGDLLKNRTALVTGASSGLGADFARELARRGCDLVLVARRAERLEAVAQEIRASSGVRVRALPADLADEAARLELFARLRAEGAAVDMLVNNAGFGTHGSFAASDWERNRAMLQIDILALTHLTRLFLPDMLARRSGRILLLASVGAYQPTPTYAVYAAAKSYVLNFGEALRFELRGSGVSCTVLSPGITATEFQQVAGQKPTLYQRLVMMQSPQVARIGIDSLLRGRGSVVPGPLNALLAWGNRLIPRSWAAGVSYWLMNR